MAADDKPRASRPSRADSARPRGKEVPERPFDMWLHKQLHAMYDEIASEPLPTDLLKMIDHDAEAGSKPDESATGPVGGKKP